jgi:son of sevenless-like protein
LHFAFLCSSSSPHISSHLLTSPHISSEWFIRTADTCATMHNFNATFEIVAGLESASIYRLKKTWAGLGYADKAKWQKLKVLSNGNKNRLAYRDAAKRVRERQERPAIPFLGVALGDLTFIEVM